MKGTILAGVLLLVLSPACSSAFTPKACGDDGDCPANYFCVGAAAESYCAAADSAPLRIGMSAPASGPSQELGIEMRRGISLAFDEQNENGGVHGRKLVLEFRDDSYIPELAEASARELLDVRDVPGTKARCPTTTTPVVTGQVPVAEGALTRGPKGVLALIGNVGTPTMVRSGPIAVETGALYFGAFTGAGQFLRDGISGPCSKYVFNVRASYRQEARATLEYFLRLGVVDYRHLVSFDQGDSFGQAGYEGLTAAYSTLKTDLPSTEAIKRVRYTRDEPSTVPPQVAETARYLANLLAADSQPHVVGIFMTNTYGAAARFITGLRDWQYANDAEQSALKKATRLTVHFSNVSFVGADALATRLKAAGEYATPNGPRSYTDGVLVSQVVPNFKNDGSDGVRSYTNLIAATGARPTFTSLEGYLVSRVFIAGIVGANGKYAPEALIKSFENLPTLNLGFGASAGFTPSDHSYSKSVWGTAITQNGEFDNRYYWSEGTPLQVYE